MTTIGKEITSLIDRFAIRDKRIQLLLDLPEWTPAMGALIVYGIEPRLNCIDIPDKALDFEGKPVTLGSSSALFSARRLLAQWEDWQQDQGFTEFAMSPYQFIEWCIDEGVEGHWFNLLRCLTHCSELGYFEALPSPLDIPLPAQPILLPLPADQSLPTNSTASASGSSASTLEGSKSANSSLGWQEYTGVDQSLSKHLLSTTSLAAAFEDIGLWEHKVRWSKNLPVQAWAHVARRIKGMTKRASYWDPVAFAVRAHFERRIGITVLTDAFNSKKALQPWLPKWQRFVAELGEWK